MMKLTHPKLKANKFAGKGQALPGLNKQSLHGLDLPDRNNQNAAQVSGSNLSGAINSPNQFEDPLRTSLNDNADPFMAMVVDGQQPRLDPARKRKFAGMLGRMPGIDMGRRPLRKA
jgi:hypothetical protein